MAARRGNMWDSTDLRRTYRGMAMFTQELWHISVTAMYAQYLTLGTEPAMDLNTIGQKMRWGFTTEDSAGTRHEIDVAHSLAVIAHNRATRPGPYDLHLAAHAQIMVALAQVGDGLVTGGVHQKLATEPLVQFVRHIRNAFAHGGYWSFTSDQDFVKKPARMSTIELRRDMDGDTIWNTFQVGDYVLLMQELATLLHSKADDAGEFDPRV